MNIDIYVLPTSYIIHTIYGLIYVYIIYIFISVGANYKPILV